MIATSHIIIFCSLFNCCKVLFSMPYYSNSHCFINFFVHVSLTEKLKPESTISICAKHHTFATVYSTISKISVLCMQLSVQGSRTGDWVNRIYPGPFVWSKTQFFWIFACWTGFMKTGSHFLKRWLVEILVQSQCKHLISKWLCK